MITAGLLTITAFLLVFLKLSRISKKRLLGYDLILDLLVTGFLAWLLAGTYSGMMAAIVGGLTFSIILFIAKHYIGYQRFSWKYRRWISNPN